MNNEEKLPNRKRLGVIIVVFGIVLLFAIYLIEGILPPIPMDYSGAQISYEQEDYDVSTENACDIILSDEKIEVSDSGVTISGSNIRITQSGVYRLLGSLSDGCIYISAEDGGYVHLIFSGMEISYSESPPIYVTAADKVIITAEEGTDNRVTSTANGGLESAIYSECDLTFNGEGSLLVQSTNGIAINCKANVRIAEGNIEVEAKENAIKAGYGVSVMDGTLNLTSGADAIRTTGAGKTSDKWVGAVSIEGGDIHITSSGDAINSDSVICVYDGEITIVSGGGSTEQSASSIGMGRPGENEVTKSDTSSKGLKAESGVYICGGVVNIDSADDTIHSDNNVTISGGTISLYSDDDGIHADDMVSISGGEITVLRCSEGIEGHYIEVNDGDIDVTASDDGVNATSGSNPIASVAKLMETEFLGTGGKLIINGGSILIISSGDGLDSNGSIIQTGGSVIVNCMSNGADGALDYDGTYSINGGELAAFGNGGMMLQTITASKSSAYALTVGADITAGSIVSVVDEQENTMLTFESASDASCVVIASDALKEGEQISVYVDDDLIGIADISKEGVQIGTITSSKDGPEGEQLGDMNGNHNGSMPGMGMPFLRWIPVVLIFLIGIPVVIIVIRIRKKRKEKPDGI